MALHRGIQGPERYTNPIKHFPTDILEFPQLDSTPFLENTIDETARDTQANRELVANAVLTALSLSMQGNYDVYQPSVGPTPISLYLLSIAESGQKKSSLLDEFLDPIHEAEREFQEGHKDHYKQWQQEHKKWKNKTRKLRNTVENKELQGKDAQSEQNQLDELLRHEPLKPQFIRFVYENIHISTLIRYLYENGRVGGLISSEGTIILHQRQLQELANLNNLWDNRPVNLDTRSESITLRDSRLMISLSITPGVLQEHFKKNLNRTRDSGFWSRFLVSFPINKNVGEPQGTTVTREFRNAMRNRIYRESKKNAQRCINKEGRGLIYFSAHARSQFMEVRDHIDRLSQPGGPLYKISDFASKAPNNIARIAAILINLNGVNKVDGSNAPEGYAKTFHGIDPKTLNDAIKLCAYYANQFRNIFVAMSNEEYYALLLGEWFYKEAMYKNRAGIKRHEIKQYGHSKKLREISRNNMNHALYRLEEANFIVRDRSTKGEDIYFSEFLINFPMNAYLLLDDPQASPNFMAFQQHLTHMSR